MSAADKASSVARLFRKMRVISCFGGEPAAWASLLAAMGAAAVTAGAAGVATGLTTAPEAILALPFSLGFADAAAAASTGSDALGAAFASAPEAGAEAAAGAVIAAEADGSIADDAADIGPGGRNKEST